MRTRMSGGVRGVRSIAAPISIIVILRLCDFLFKIIRLVPSQSSHEFGIKHVAVFIFRFEV